MTVTTDLVHVAIDVQASANAVTPKLVDVHYRHAEGTGHDDRPHRVVWEVTGLQSGQSVKITLLGIPELDGDPSHDTVRDTLFGEEPGDTRQTRHEWTIPYGTESVESGLAWRSTRLTTTEGRITITYAVELWGPNGKISTLDPGVRVIPDP